MFDNIEAIVSAIGTDKVAITMDLALTEWDSADQRGAGGLSHGVRHQQRKLY